MATYLKVWIERWNIRKHPETACRVCRRGVAVCGGCTFVTTVLHLPSSTPHSHQLRHWEAGYICAEGLPPGTDQQVAGKGQPVARGDHVGERAPDVRRAPQGSPRHPGAAAQLLRRRKWFPVSCCGWTDYLSQGLCHRSKGSMCLYSELSIRSQTYTHTHASKSLPCGLD